MSGEHACPHCGFRSIPGVLSGNHFCIPRAAPASPAPSEGETDPEVVAALTGTPTPTGAVVTEGGSWPPPMTYAERFPSPDLRAPADDAATTPTAMCLAAFSGQCSLPTGHSGDHNHNLIPPPVDATERERVRDIIREELKPTGGRRGSYTLFYAACDRAAERITAELLRSVPGSERPANATEPFDARLAQFRSWLVSDLACRVPTLDPGMVGQITRQAAALLRSAPESEGPCYLSTVAADLRDLERDLNRLARMVGADAGLVAASIAARSAPAGPTEAWLCPDCGVGAATDEEGLCQTCGATCCSVAWARRELLRAPVAPAEPWTAEVEGLVKRVCGAYALVGAEARHPNGSPADFVALCADAKAARDALLARLAPAPAETQAVTDGEIDRLAGEG